MRLLAAELALALSMIASSAVARGGGHTSGGHTSSGRGAATAAGKGSTGGLGCPSGARAHSSGSSIKELDAYRRDAFQRRNPCPSTGKTYGQCPGFEARDVPPEHRGGAWTMRWMTTEEAEKSPDGY